MTAPTDEEIYRSHAEELTRFATALVGAGDAEDVVADAVLRCLATAKWAGVENQRAYLYRAVTNQARNHLRSRRRRESRESELPPLSSGDGTDARVDELALAIRQLSVDQRTVLYLRFWEELGIPEIAERTGMSERTVHRNLKSARTRLGELL